MFQYINLLKGTERHHSVTDADMKKMSVDTMFLIVFVWSHFTKIQVHSINAATKSEEVLNCEVLTHRI